MLTSLNFKNEKQTMTCGMAGGRDDWEQGASGVVVLAIRGRQPGKAASNGQPKKVKTAQGVVGKLR